MHCTQQITSFYWTKQQYFKEFSVKISIQNITNDKCSHLVLKLSSTCSHTRSKSLLPLSNCRGPIVLKCEVIGVLLNIRQKISRKQYVSIILAIHLNARTNEVNVCSSKCWHTNWYHDRFAERWPSAEKTISCDVFLANCNWSVQAVVLEVTWSCNSEDLFVREPTKVHHGGWITLEKTSTAVKSCNLVGFH